MEGRLIRGDGNLFSLGCAVSMHDPSRSATGQWDWGFHTVRSDFNPGDHRFGPRVDGIVKIWKHL